MTRAELRAFIQAGVTALSTSHTFGSGRITQLNQIRSITFPYAWLVSPGTDPDISITGNAPTDNWNIELHIGQQDRIDSDYTAYEILIDTSDETARQLLKNYNDVISGYATAVIEGVGIEPFIKKHAHCSTGVILSFILTSPDTTNRC